ncbi:monocarboxylate transporter 14 isoform X2 [Peromyscus californicus insignis]|uniref:monocarboxylate transporter 14 isoform X2 n=1 Tax=Peromyscus californicus insignis TaxID=564181 RepID=UPI0022A6F46E|nr:monocarboxylate transporter 14 isoform X2 [Peromyscus californicus insignis]
MYTSHEDIGYDLKDDPKAKKALKPHPDIDGGWAWMMVLSSFFVHILIMGSQMALGVLNVEWLEEFHQSRGLTAWVSSLSMGITLIVGLGSGMAYLPAVVMVGRYFQKRRALAQGLSTTGTGFGTFLMTVLLKYLCAEYGWRNAMFIQGAVSLNLCVCGALMRPLSPGKVENCPRGEEPCALPAYSTESVKSGGPLGMTEEQDRQPENEETVCDLQAQECQGQTRPRKNMCAFRVLKTVSQLTVRVQKGFRDWYSGYFGTASLFTNRVFVAFIFWALFAYSSFVIPFIHLPEIVSLYNLSEQNDVFPLTSIIAVLHIFGKVILGAVADLPCTSVWNVFLIANFTLVSSIFLLPLMHTYASLAVICALIGFSSGYFSLMPVVTEDLVGTEHLANAYGIIICANGISALLGPPFAGWIFDITQKYDFSFFICGLLYMVGILFLLIQPCIQMVEQSRRKYTDGAHV